MSDSVIEIRDATLRIGSRTLWSQLHLDVTPGEFVAVLGPNGSGKTSLLRVLLGQQPLDSGSVHVLDSAPGRAKQRVGYVPQQRAMDEQLLLRGADLVRLGLDGHRWGPGLLHRRQRKRRVAAAIDSVGATSYAHAPVTTLSGGEQQRIRVAQALVGQPDLLLCDEPLASLDPTNQSVVSELIDRQRRAHGTAVLFVTHEINSILPYVDRVVYLVEGRFRIGTPSEVMNADTLSQLYRTRVEVFEIEGQIHVTGAHLGHCENELQA